MRAYISNMVIPSAPPTCCSNLLLASVTNHKKVQREGEGSRNSSFHTVAERRNCIKAQYEIIQDDFEL